MCPSVETEFQYSLTIVIYRHAFLEWPFPWTIGLRTKPLNMELLRSSSFIRPVVLLWSVCRCRLGSIRMQIKPSTYSSWTTGPWHPAAPILYKRSSSDSSFSSALPFLVLPLVITLQAMRDSSNFALASWETLALNLFWQTNPSP